MAERRTGLGKGLGALIPSISTPPRSQADAADSSGQQAPATSPPTATRPVDLLFGVESAAPARTEAAPGSGETAAEAGPPRGGKGAALPAAAPRAAPSAAGAAGSAAAGSAGAGSAAAGAGPSLAPAPASPAGAGGQELVAVPGTEFALIPITAIAPNPKQPREVFDEDELAELAESIKEVGLLQPIVVRPAAPDPGEAGAVQRYELVMGERRWRASGAAGLAEIPAIIRQTGDSDLLLDALLENLHRAQLNPLEEAAAYRQLLDDFGCTQEELSARIARSRPQISNTLRLLKLPPLVQRRLAAGVVSAGHARALLGLEDAAAMERLAQRIVAEGLSVRTTEELVALGEVPAAPKRKQPTVRGGTRHDALDALQERLTDRLDTKVRVALGKTKGRIAIDFASVADLNRILALIAPEDPGVLK
ncbi:MAG: ParB/RepB/Spo0J family partition protein [Bifidobacteriaceae bacterium]|jgi:ParB family chromosome partitioning protein|nr:ParB/RepB/Spo0J family partition protein [Bifidobacteriaceae bacterium]